MAILERQVLLGLNVELDGQIVKFYRREFYDDITDEVKMEGSRTGVRIDVGDDITGEDVLIRDTVNGNLHTPARKTVRDAVKFAEAAERGKIDGQ